MVKKSVSGGGAATLGWPATAPVLEVSSGKMKIVLHFPACFSERREEYHALERELLLKMNENQHKSFIYEPKTHGSAHTRSNSIPKPNVSCFLFPECYVHPPVLHVSCCFLAIRTITCPNFSKKFLKNFHVFLIIFLTFFLVFLCVNS
jgi:hypothetical protein